MNLLIQIRLIIFSFLFGIYFAFMLDFNKKYMFDKNCFKNLIFSISFLLFNSFLYFYILEKVNNGILHYYSFLFIIVGVLVQNLVVNMFKK